MNIKPVVSVIIVKKVVVIHLGIVKIQDLGSKM
jgi:hypothetical protein